MWNIAMMNLGEAPIYRPPVTEHPVVPKVRPPLTEAELASRREGVRIANTNRLQRKEADKRSILDYVYTNKEVTLRSVALRFHWSEGKTSDLMTILRKEERLVKFNVGTTWLWKVSKF